MNKCLGCGIRLQNIDKDRDGYVDDLERSLCNRCFMIKNYGKNKAVNKTNYDFDKIINSINRNDLVVYISSLLTLNLDYINRFDKVLLVLTKRDILPKSVKDSKIINYIKERYNNIIDIVIVSAYKKYNLDNLYNKLMNYSKKKIYFVGATNSGKSTLINEMIKSYNGIDGSITMSNYPSTTLDVVSVKIGNLDINDTPGLIIQNSIINNLDGKWIKKINNKKEIKPVTIQINGTGAILIDGILRMEYETDSSSMTFYVSNNLDISNISLKNPRMFKCESYNYLIDNNQDLVIEDIGFIKFTKKVNVKVYLENKIYMYVRDNLI